MARCTPVSYTHLVDFKKALELKGGKSYVSLDSELETAGLGNDLRVKVKRTDATSDKDQILFESPYGSIKAVQAKTGKEMCIRDRSMAIVGSTTTSTTALLSTVRT